MSSSFLSDWGNRTDSGTVEDLYRLPPGLVALSIQALRRGARELLQDHAESDADVDVLSAEGAATFAGRWDVLQNYAEQAWRGDHPVFGSEPYSREVIDASYDPAYRAALRQWEIDNPELLRDDVQWPEAYRYAAELDLQRYAVAVTEPEPHVASALRAGRLPCTADLVVRSPDLARSVLAIWSATSSDSSRYRSLWSEDELADERLTQVVAPAAEADQTSSKGNATQRVRNAPQRVGAALEVGVLHVLENLFDLSGLDREVRRQLSGTQFGADVVFRASTIRSTSTCLVECKNVSSPLTVSTLADKVLQAEAAFEAEPVDHWVLISPHQDPNNELDRYVQRWNARGTFPFTVQIWSPQTGVRRLLALEPSVYRDIYGNEPPGGLDFDAVVNDFAERLAPPLRLPERLARYINDPSSYVLSNERAWLQELDHQIKRYCYDDRGARLERPALVEVLAALDEPPHVALLVADFGEGKSFFTVALCSHLRERFMHSPTSGTLLPIRLYLRGFRHTDSPSEFLRSQLELVGLTTEDLYGGIRRARLAVVLDGLDEMSVGQDTETVRSNLDKVAGLLEILESAPVLVTSRPHFFKSTSERERFLDRLRRPKVFRLAQPSRGETVAHLRAFAESRQLSRKLTKIKELYDPIGLAGKVLFLEMIKVTLPDLPDDKFNEVILYETYVQKSLGRKAELLRDPANRLTDQELTDQLQELLERIAVAIHVSGEGSVDLREFLAEAGGAAKLLWRSAADDDGAGSLDDDAATRVGTRSLLRRVESHDEDAWLVDFFHRSMKEYFIARALVAALSSEDPFEATRAILLCAAVQREILGFFRLLSDDLDNPESVLSAIGHSARLGSSQHLAGAGAISLYCALRGGAPGEDWRSLELDGALLSRCDLRGSDFRGSSLRRADLASADLSNADFRDADLTDASLDSGGNIIAVAADVLGSAFLCLTPDSDVGRLAVGDDGRISAEFIIADEPLRWPRSIYPLAEDIALIVGQAKVRVVELASGVASTLAHFRISNDIRHVILLSPSLLGLVVDSEVAGLVATLLDIETGEVHWRTGLPSGEIFAWTSEAVFVATWEGVIRCRRDVTDVVLRGEGISALHALDGLLAVGTVEGDVLCSEEALARVPGVHVGATIALAGFGDFLVSTGVDGAIAVVGPDDGGVFGVRSRLTRHLHCVGARVRGLQGERELEAFLANGAHDD